MAIQIQDSATSTLLDIGGPRYNAVKIQQMPVDYGALGSYKKSLSSGTMAAGLTAGSDVFQFRWTDATRLAIVQRVVLDGFSTATAFSAATQGNFSMYKVTGYSVDGSGGTSGTLTGNNSKYRTNMGTSLLGSIRISSTAALTAGTRTVGASPVGQAIFTTSTSANSAVFTNRIPLFGENIGPCQPLVFVQNEGFIIQATVPSTGTWQFGITVIWTEVTSY